MQIDVSNNNNSGVMGMKYAIHTFTGLPYDTPADDFIVGASDKALVTSILSAGTFFGMFLAVSHIISLSNMRQVLSLLVISPISSVVAQPS